MNGRPLQAVQAEVREFLTSRRARITPDAVGLPVTGNRRVPGLRRSEVADLAGISVDYYAKLERGQIAGASAGVLEALSRALHLNEAEHRHLYDLARAADGVPTSARGRSRAASPHQVRTSLERVVDAVTGAVAFVRDEMQNIIAVNDLGREFYSPVLGEAGGAGRQDLDGRANLARFQFLDPASREFYPDWDTMARMCVGVMHAEVGRNPGHRGLQDLVGELSTRSTDFAELWAAHDVRIHGSGTKRFHHPEVGELVLDFEELQVTADDGLHLFVYSAEPGSASEEKLRLLATLAATRRTHTTSSTQTPGTEGEESCAE
ncbi:MAG TPA: helix-turn-helix transcriptional regulator [Candidatus Corynebacterium avicola]|uniref:Helix-turn-helix transcriptional regulator n=1 Tax=Candidatus Corynebacterium avicola TaxID=2838527 RepID=A0A9D1RNR1_9CORY|nr:helix-turn-helix transcriptional regulator [Candidatus Corynebacterium avicola]